MIDLYTWTTPNGRKVSILLEELSIPYNPIAINITKDEQFTPEFLSVSPNNKIPAIVDHETGIQLMESGAIMVYLADKYEQFLPKEPKGRAQVTEWLMWQMGGLGPMLGQVHHFVKFNAGKSAYAEERFGNEARRLYRVLDEQLARGHGFIAGDYSIADMACWPWISRYEWQGIDLAEFPHVKSWYQNILKRPAVQKGYQVPKNMGPIPAG